jgi:hypothetical protein
MRRTRGHARHTRRARRRRARARLQGRLSQPGTGRGAAQRRDRLALRSDRRPTKRSAARPPWACRVQTRAQAHTPPPAKILAQTSRITARALASGRWIRTIVRMDENPGTPPAPGERRSPRSDLPGALMSRAGSGAGPRARTRARTSGQCRFRRRGRSERCPALTRGRPRRDRGQTRGTRRARRLALPVAFLMNVRLAGDSSFTGGVRRGDPGSGSRPRTGGPSRGDGRRGLRGDRGAGQRSRCEWPALGPARTHGRLREALPRSRCAGGRSKDASEFALALLRA